MRGLFDFSNCAAKDAEFFAVIGRALVFATHFEKQCHDFQISASVRDATNGCDLTRVSGNSLGQRTKPLARRYEELFGDSVETDLDAGVKARNSIVHAIADYFARGGHDEKIRDSLLMLIRFYTRQVAEADCVVASLATFEEGTPPIERALRDNYPDRAVAWVLGT